MRGNILLNMTEQQLINLEVRNISLEDGTYNFDISIRDNYIDEIDEYSFSLKQRHGYKEILLFPKKQSQVNEYSLFSFSMSPFQHEELLSEKAIWDMYINRKTGEEIKQSRIKSNDDYLRFLSLVFPKTNTMFYPFATKKRRFSFLYNDYCMFANFEEVFVNKNDVTFKGHFNFPPLFKDTSYKIVDMHLIIKNQFDEEVETIQVDGEDTPHLNTKFEGNGLLQRAGFKGSFPISKIILDGQKIFYKFYFALTYEKNGSTETIYSNRMRWLQDKKTLKSKIIQTKTGKVKIKVKPTRESKYFSLQAYDYRFLREVSNELRRKWIRFRRGKLVINMYRRAFQTFGKIPSKKNLVVFESFHGKQYSDNPRAIYEYMKDKDMDYEMYWSADRRHIQYFKQLVGVNSVRRFSIKWLILMARARFWVTNTRLPLWIPKPKDTIYVQTWHGTPLKRLAADMEEVYMPGTNTQKYKENFLKESSKWDYLVSPNAYSTEIFKRAFGFEKNLIESGYPRNDFLINNNNNEMAVKIKKECNLPLNKKVILYAPTWRDNQFYSKGRYKFDLQLDLEKMKSELADDYIIVLRLHYLVAENLDLTGYEDFVFDLSKHEDIRELYLIADLLITDYSSVFFDYANLKRPMMFFVYDIEEYRDILRGFYFDFEEQAPGPLVKSTDELITEIKHIENNGFTPSKDIEQFYNRFCYLEDGCASERVVREVFLK